MAVEGIYGRCRGKWEESRTGSKHQILLVVWRISGLTRDGNPSLEIKFSGANGDRQNIIFPIQLTTSRIGNLTRLIHTMLKVLTIHTLLHDDHTYILCLTGWAIVSTLVMMTGSRFGDQEQSPL